MPPPTQTFNPNVFYGLFSAMWHSILWLKRDEIYEIFVVEKKDGYQSN